MDAILDYLVSSTWLFMAVFFLIALIPTLAIIRKPFKSYIASRVLQGATIAGSFALMMYLILGPHGYAVQFVRGIANEKYICLMELHWQGDGDGGSYESNRLYVFDRISGELLMRQNSTYEELLCIRENEAVIYENGEATGYDLLSGSVIHHWSKEEGFDDYPELKNGVSEINRSSEILNAKNEAWLTITAKNGHHYCLNLITDELIEADFPPREYNPIGYSCDEYGVKYVNPKNLRYWEYNFDDTKGELKELTFQDYDYRDTSLGGEYIHPKMIAVFPELQLFIFEHSETTEDINTIFTAYNFSHEKVWEKHQDEFITQDKISEDPFFGIAIPYQNELIITLGGALVRFDPTDGTVIWAKAY